nr:MAG TPA: hypothetical protein [Caudoviricetes sp.]
MSIYTLIIATNDAQIVRVVICRHYSHFTFFCNAPCGIICMGKILLKL